MTKVSKKKCLKAAQKGSKGPVAVKGYVISDAQQLSHIPQGIWPLAHGFIHCPHSDTVWMLSDNCDCSHCSSNLLQVVSVSASPSILSLIYVPLPCPVACS